jgi:hypothetical protein
VQHVACFPVPELCTLLVLQAQEEADGAKKRARAAEAALRQERLQHQAALQRSFKECQGLQAELRATQDTIHGLRLKARELARDLDAARHAASPSSRRALYCPESDIFAQLPP